MVLKDEKMRQIIKKRVKSNINEIKEKSTVVSMKRKLSGYKRYCEQKKEDDKEYGCDHISPNESINKIYSSVFFK